MSSSLPLKKNFGREVAENMPYLARQLDEMYTDFANALTLLAKKNILTGADPLANEQRNSFYSIGDLAIRTDTDTAWIMTSRTSPNVVVWKQIT